MSYLSKSTIFPNFSPQFIIQFDQTPKDLSKIPYFPVDSTLIYHYTLNSNNLHRIGKFGNIFDTRPCEINDLAVSSRHVSIYFSSRGEGDARKALAVGSGGLTIHTIFMRHMFLQKGRLRWTQITRSEITDAHHVSFT